MVPGVFSAFFRPFSSPSADYEEITSVEEKFNSKINFYALGGMEIESCIYDCKNIVHDLLNASSCDLSSLEKRKEIHELLSTFKSEVEKNERLDPVTRKDMINRFERSFYEVVKQEWIKSISQDAYLIIKNTDKTIPESKAQKWKDKFFEGLEFFVNLSEVFTITKKLKIDLTMYENYFGNIKDTIVNLDTPKKENQKKSRFENSPALVQINTMPVHVGIQELNNVSFAEFLKRGALEIPKPKQGIKV